MKKTAFILAMTAALVLTFSAACSSKTDPSATPTATTQGPLSATGLAIKDVLTNYWLAFNKYDEATCLSYIAPDYVAARTPGLESDINSFKAGEAYKVSMVPALFSEPVDIGDSTGRLGVRVTVSIVPAGLSADQYLLYYMENVNGSWMIDRQLTDRTKSPPRAPTNLECTIVNSHEVDLTWKGASSSSSTSTATTTAAPTTATPTMATARPPLTGYKVERSTDPQFIKDTKFFNLASSVTSYKDTSAKGGATYYYRVVAFNANGDSASTSVVTIQMPK